MKNLVSDAYIAERIYMFRRKKVMLDSDLADLYGVETKVFNQAVKRNLQRFPEDFMFQLTHEEFESLRSQIVTSKGRGGRRYLPSVFTELGVAMLSSVLNSERAIQVNIQIMRTFTKLREMVLENMQLRQLIEKIDRRSLKNADDIKNIYRAIQKMIAIELKPKRPIGFSSEVDKKKK